MLKSDGTELTCKIYFLQHALFNDSLFEYSANNNQNLYEVLQTSYNDIIITATVRLQKLGNHAGFIK